MRIRTLLQELVTEGTTPFVLQIGAMDGITADNLYEFLSRHDWPALLVEPIKEHFQTLQENYRSRDLVQFANVAISDTNGETAMYRISSETLEKHNLPSWGHQAASLYKDRTALGWKNIQPHLIEERVSCLTLETLLTDHNVTTIDVLQIDAEGHDYQILKQLDFTRYKPRIINLEFVNLPEAEQEATKALLARQGYKYKKTGYDLVATL